MLGDCSASPVTAAVVSKRYSPPPYAQPLRSQETAPSRR